MKNLFMIFSVIFVCLTSIAHANCPYNGKVYPPGARVGPSACTPNGTWQPPIPQPQPQVQQPQRLPPQGQQPPIPQPQGQSPQTQVSQPQQKMLAPIEARQRIQDLNRNRTAMQGINPPHHCG